jgi:hypothetical protein
VLWIIAILGNLTVAHRIVFTYQEAERLEEAQLNARRTENKDKGVGVGR